MFSQAQLRTAAFDTALQRLRAGDPLALAEWLCDHLLGHVMPFWERHAIDERGGILTCIDDDGAVRSTDKWMWSQWRAVWVFSRIYRSIDRHERWLKYARDIAHFSMRYAWSPGRRQWSLLVGADGTVLRGHESTHVDAFAVYGLVELHLASRETAYLDLARETADASLRELAGAPAGIPHFPYPIPRDAKPHAVPMMWSLVLAELGAASGDDRYLRAAAGFADEVFRDFHRADRDLCLEYVRIDGSELPPPDGTVVVPGHAIEDMWFQIHIASILGGEAGRTLLARRLIARHLELGWDETGGGGILLAIDADGREPVGWKFADTKLWWPHTEALYATLLAWQIEPSAEFFDWYRRLWRFCLDHYVDWAHGEWRQKLERSLAPMSGTIALPVKDPFHLPRSLILQIELLRRMAGVANGQPVPHLNSAAAALNPTPSP